MEETSLLFALLGIVPQAHISRLLKGEVLTYSTHPSAGVNAIPPAVGQWYETQRKAQLEKPSTEEQEWYREYLRNRKILRFSVGYRLSSVSNEILCQLGVEKEQTIQPALPRCEHRLFQTTVSLDEIVSDRSRLTREWNQWSESSESLRAWLQRLKPLPNRTPRPPDWQPFQEQRYMRNFVMPTQRLELLAWQYGLPIVADAYRLGLEVLIDTSTPLAAIQSLQNTHWMRREGDYLLVRRKRYWEWRAVEPPEAPIRELEAKFQKEGTLTIDDYARFVAALDEKPYQWLLESSFSYGLYTLAVRFPTEPLGNLPLLRFWATLTPAQRQAVLAGEFLPLRTLTLPQRKAFEHALEPLFPHPNRLLDPPSECRFTTFRWIFPVWDLEDTKAAVPAESGFGLLGAPKKLRRTALFTDSSRGTPMLIFSEDRGSDELDTAQFLEEGETFKPRLLMILSSGGSEAPARLLAGAGINIYDEEGRLLYVNKAQAELVGFDRGEMVGRKAVSLILPGEAGVLSSHMEKRRLGISSTYELSLTRKGGGRVRALAAGRPLLDEKEWKHPLQPSAHPVPFPLHARWRAPAGFQTGPWSGCRRLRLSDPHHR